MTRPRIRFSLRSKLALLSMMLLALPWVGYQYVQEMERFLLESQRQSVMSTARAVGTALHDRPELFGLPSRRSAELDPLGSLLPNEALLAPAVGLDPGGRRSGAREVEAILKGLDRSRSRIWVADRDLQVLARAGSLKPPPEPQQDGGWLQQSWHRLLAWLVPPPRQEYIERVDQEPLARSPEISSAFLGASSVWVRVTGDGRPSIVAAAQPVWVGDQVLGVVVVEETTHSILSLRNQALERLMLLTLTGFVITAVLVLGFASRLSWRIRRLRDEAESAIDARGRITNLAAASRATDEVGDLSRSFSALLSRLGQHHSYLESMASRLSHELRTPIAVVRSSLENLHMEPLPESARTYIGRAEAGVSRLSRIFSRMSEANRMEQSLATTEVERFDLGRLVDECTNGYRSAHAGRRFEAAVPRHPVWIRGAPDLAAQMLDKLVENAVDFAAGGTPIRVTLRFDGESHAVLAIENRGPTIPEELRARLFESMVSGRTAEAGDTPHLGLGLYVARMIAGFHRGELSATNLADGSGVRFEARLPCA